MTLLLYICGYASSLIEAAVTDRCDPTSGNLLYTVSTTLLKYIVDSKIKTPAQLEAAFEFFAITGSKEFSLTDFEEACDVDEIFHYPFGTEIEVSPVEEIFEDNNKTILEQGYESNVGESFGHVRESLPHADPKIVKKLDENMFELLGEKTSADTEKPTKEEEKVAKVEEKKAVVEATPEPSKEELNSYSSVISV
ncbi:Glutaminyl-tRNA synthetase class Ib non-specific RNA-binding domain N-terminal [Arabidopsis suecica]|uniref:Glutaminyl-tRNA synthetase class Ib non-specific RNA-binding domain N-terminal n=1 Tax=Arabidopsis suecica TaxID=45249 RepID=A0A8T2CP26_ARASU|nr:Glutaminyl-tRNA synthetase class Ib non-specific RNA-binding domain N-terminal [Arabidopsis suecica]